MLVGLGHHSQTIDFLTISTCSNSMTKHPNIDLSISASLWNHRPTKTYTYSRDIILGLEQFTYLSWTWTNILNATGVDSKSNNIDQAYHKNMNIMKSTNSLTINKKGVQVRTVACHSSRKCIKNSLNSTCSTQSNDFIMSLNFLPKF